VPSCLFAFPEKGFNYDFGIFHSSKVVTHQH